MTAVLSTQTLINKLHAKDINSVGGYFLICAQRTPGNSTERANKQAYLFPLFHGKT